MSSKSYSVLYELLMKIHQKLHENFADITILRLHSHDAGTFWKRWKIWWIDLPFTWKRHIFCGQILKTVHFETGTLIGKSWKRHCVNTWKRGKQKIFRRFWNETGQFLGCRYTSLASKSYNEFLPSKIPTVFRLFRYQVNASSNFAAITFSPFSKCASIMWTQSYSYYSFCLCHTTRKQKNWIKTDGSEIPIFDNKKLTW